MPSASPGSKAVGKKGGVTAFASVDKGLAQTADATKAVFDGQGQQHLAMDLDPWDGEDKVALQGLPGYHHAACPPSGQVKAQGLGAVQLLHAQAQWAQGIDQANAVGYVAGAAKAGGIPHAHPGPLVKQPLTGGSHYSRTGTGQRGGRKQIRLDQYVQTSSP